jgi:hypothetical protein
MNPLSGLAVLEAMAAGLSKADRLRRGDAQLTDTPHL